ncbi:MAG: sulfurtransferase [Burkholderiales bacterium]|jgi:thiosulfate/3-mercaptopyruvate sulfurtransferase
MNPTPLITPQALHARLGERSLRVVDLRHDLMKPGAGRAAWQVGHIPGALHLDLDADLSGPKTGRNGRHPLPDPLEFAQVLGRAGIGDADEVVVYDDAGGAFAARLWWMLRWLGHDAVSVLDGGWQAWTAAGLPVSVDAPASIPAVFTPRVPRPWTVDADTVAAGLADASLMVVDARAPERFRGEVEPIDPVGGHIPGARNRFMKTNLDDSGRFKPAATLRAEFEALLGGRSADQLVCQCGSGVTACHNLLAMAVAGIEAARLYPGSWSEWCSDPARPVATGEA